MRFSGECDALKQQSDMKLTLETFKWLMSPNSCLIRVELSIKSSRMSSTVLSLLSVVKQLEAFGAVELFS
jgi:hypothetical protein